MEEMKKFVVSEEDTAKVTDILEAIGIQYHFLDEGSTENAMVETTMCDGAQEQPIEPENIDKVVLDTPFVRAQLSTKNQMILRNVIAIISSIGVVIAFILEKLGIM